MVIRCHSGADVTLLNSTNQQSLYFLSPRPYNGGLYQCNASDSGSTISGRVNISVYKRPTIVTPPEEQTVSVGEPVMFDCVATVKQVKVGGVSQVLTALIFSSLPFSLLPTRGRHSTYLHTMAFVLRSDTLPATNSLFGGKTGPPVFHIKMGASR